MTARIILMTGDQDWGLTMRKVLAIAVVVLGSVTGVASAGHGAASGGSSSDDGGGGTPRLVRQPTPEAVVAEHVDALNTCNVDRLMAQYPKTIAILFREA